MTRISVDQLANEITKTLEEYTEDIEKELERSKQRNARAGAKKLRETSPINIYGKRRGKYRKGWTSTKRGTSYIIRNRTDYQLTHLLEKGHALWQGGRSPAIPHIKPVEQEVVEKYVKDVERAIKK